MNPKPNSEKRGLIGRKYRILPFFLLLASGVIQADEGTPPGMVTLPQFYRNLILKVRTEARFKIPTPAQGDQEFSYQLHVGKPVFDLPVVREYSSDEKSGAGVRVFFDKIFLEDGSWLELSGERIPLTCIFVRGQDNRFAKDSPLLPDLLLRIYLVGNDYSCTGPVNPGWPENGGKKEMWDTYLRFDVRDPTIMLPVDTTLRYRWNEYSAVLLDSGNWKAEVRP